MQSGGTGPPVPPVSSALIWTPHQVRVAGSATRARAQQDNGCSRMLFSYLVLSLDIDRWKGKQAGMSNSIIIKASKTASMPYFPHVLAY